MTAQPQSQEFQGAFACDYTDFPRALTIREWRQLETQRRRRRRRLLALWRRSR
jgi:hypothetical protein